MDITQHDFELYRGDTCALDVVLTDSQGAPYDVSGARVDMLVLGDTGESLRPEITVSGNTVHVAFAAESTRRMRWTRGKYDLQLTFGETVQTVLRGKIRLLEDVTP